jgi:hypothetical protein
MEVLKFEGHSINREFVGGTTLVHLHSMTVINNTDVEWID